MTKPLGIVLIVLGLMVMIWGGFSYTTRKKVVDIGPIEATKDTTHHVPIEPIVGVVALAGGVALVATSRR